MESLGDLFLEIKHLDSLSLCLGESNIDDNGIEKLCRGLGNLKNLKILSLKFGLTG